MAAPALVFFYIPEETILKVNVDAWMRAAAAVRKQESLANWRDCAVSVTRAGEDTKSRRGQDQHQSPRDNRNQSKNQHEGTSQHARREDAARRVCEAKQGFQAMGTIASKRSAFVR